MRLVLDTNVVVSGLLWDGAPTRLLWATASGSATFFTSAPLLAELTEILSRPKFDRKLIEAGRSIAELVDRYAGQTILVHPTVVPRLAPDPDDDVVLGTAISARAHFVVTGDKALLSVERYDGGRIIPAMEALEMLALV